MGTRASVLVVNDDAAQLALLAGLLKKEGHDVRTCDSAEQAIEQVENIGDTDLVITDLNMPGLSGLQLLQKLRDIGSTFPVLIISASEVDSSSEIHARARSQNAHVLAPYRPTRVRDVARALLNGEMLPEEEAAARQTLSSVDRLALDKLFQVGGGALLTKVVGMFLERTPQNLDSLRAAVAENDHLAVERTAHTVKGSAGMLGARTVQETARRLEHAAADKTGHYQEPFDHLEQAFEAVKDFYSRVAAGEFRKD